MATSTPPSSMSTHTDETSTPRQRTGLSREAPPFVLPQVVFLLTLGCWYLSMILFAFSCDIPTSTLCQKANSVNWLVASYPIFVVIWSALAWVVYLAGRKRVAVFISLLPIVNAVLFVFAYAYVLA